MPTGNLAPTWELLINGSEYLPAKYKALIETVTVDATIDGADQILIKAKAYNTTGSPGERWAFVGQTILAPGNLVTVLAGYSDGIPLQALQRFRIIADDTDYSAGAVPTITIRGYSGEASMATYTEPRKWKGPIADSDIVAEIAAEYGMGIASETTDTRDRGRVKKKGMSDLEFLQALAWANGYGPPVVRYDTDLDTDVLYFQPDNLTEDDGLTFAHDPFVAGRSDPSGSLRKFRATLDLHGVPTKIQVTGWDVANQEPIVVTMEIADGGQDPVILTGSAATRAGYKVRSGSEMQVRALRDGEDPREDRIEAVAVPHIQTVDEAVAYGTRWIKARNQAFLTGRGTLTGNPKVWIRQVHNLQGMAEIHNGLWYFTGVKHVFSASGYTTAFDCDRVLEDSTPPTEA